jgi:hypothetical protein
MIKKILECLPKVFRYKFFNFYIDNSISNKYNPIVNKCIYLSLFYRLGFLFYFIQMVGSLKRGIEMCPFSLRGQVIGSRLTILKKNCDGNKRDWTRPEDIGKVFCVLLPKAVPN